MTTMTKIGRATTKLAKNEKRRTQKAFPTPIPHLVSRVAVDSNRWYGGI
jgi:hypothetical protein